MHGVLYGLAQLVAQCADLRKFREDNPEYFRAEVAGRELLLSWLLPSEDGFPVSAEMVRRVSLLSRLLQNSAEQAAAPLVTVASRYVDLPSATAQALLNSTMLVLLAALRDGASVLVVTFEPDVEFIPTVRIESDAPGVAALPETHFDRECINSIRDCGGDWSAARLAHGTWEVVLRAPV